MPHVGTHSSLFVILQRVFVTFRAGILTAVDSVGDGIFRAVERRAAERTRRFLVRRSCALNGLFHLCCAEVRNRREQQTQQRQMPVVNQQHDCVADHHHAGVKHFGGEFAHSLHAVVHVRNGFRHQLASAFFLQRRAAFAYQVGIQNALHAAVDVVGEAPDVESLDETRALNRQRDEQIRQHQHRHCVRGLMAAQNVGQALGKPPFEPRRRQQTHVVEQPGQRDEGQRQPFGTKIGADFIRTEILLVLHCLYFLCA